MSVRSTDLTSEERAKELRLAWRGLVASLIAVKPHLDKPYPDDARWTPWSRFIEHAIHKVDAALRAVESERAALEECAKWERYAKQMDSERAELARRLDEEAHWKAEAEVLAREVEELRAEVENEARRP